MRTRIVLAAVFGVIVAFAAVGGAWYLLHRSEAKICPFSGRPIHRQARAFVDIGGKEYETCCLRCAIIEAQQTGKHLRILRVADFNTGKLMQPASAWFVEGSGVNLCVRMTPGTESPGRETTYIRAFDRCSPSILAFSSEQDARAFLEIYGGTLLRLNDLEHEASSQVPKVQKP